jgi:hypothetical protein
MSRFAIAVLVALAIPATALAAPKHYYPKPHARCRSGYVRKTVRVRERKHHKWIKVKRAECVAKAKAKTEAKPTTTKPAVTPIVRAAIDPSYTQDSSDNLRVTWTYSASDTSGDLPDGTLSLSVQEPNTAGSSGGCSMDVGGNVAGGTCTQELPHYGDWDVTVSYTGASTTVAPATSTDTEDIEALPVAAVVPVATTTSLSVSDGTLQIEQGPPTLNWTYWYETSTINVSSSDPSNAGLVLSLTIDGDNGSQTITGSSVTGDGCGLFFDKIVGDNADPSTTVSGCGIPDTVLATGDTLSVNATSTASFGYLPATSSTVAVTPPWTL